MLFLNLILATMDTKKLNHTSFSLEDAVQMVECVKTANDATDANFPHDSNDSALQIVHIHFFLRTAPSTTPLSSNCRYLSLRHTAKLQIEKNIITWGGM